MPQERVVQERSIPPRSTDQQPERTENIKGLSLCDEAVAMDALEAADAEVVVNDRDEEVADNSYDLTNTFVTLRPDPQNESEAGDCIGNDVPEGGSKIAPGITSDAATVVLRTLLDLEDPRVEHLMVPFLRTEGVLETLLGFITRLPVEEKVFVEKGRHFPERWPDITPRSAFRQRDASNSNELKWSYRAMELVCNSAPSNMRAFGDKSTNIAVSLFGAFHPFSDANFHHVRKVIEYILPRQGEPVMDLYLYQHPDQSLLPSVRPLMYDAEGLPTPALPPIFAMIPYLYDSTVGCIMINLLFPPPGRTIHKARRIERLAYLQQSEFLETVISNLDVADVPLLLSGTADFICRMVEEAWRVDESLVLFMSAVGDSQITRRLVDIISGGTDEQRDAGIRVLHALLVQGTGKDFSRLNMYLAGGTLKEMVQAPIESSPLNELSAAIRRFLTEHISQLCDSLLIYRDDLRENGELKFSSYVVEAPFRTVRLYLLECIYQCLRGCEKLDDALSKISGNIWKAMVNWFFQHRAEIVGHEESTGQEIGGSLFVRGRDGQPWVHIIAVQHDPTRRRKPEEIRLHTADAGNAHAMEGISTDVGERHEATTGNIPQRHDSIQEPGFPSRTVTETGIRQAGFRCSDRNP